MRLERRATALQLVLLAAMVAGCGMRIGGPNYGDTVDGIACDQSSNVTFEATVHLWLISGGQRLEPTEGVGSTGSNCNYWVRTENDPGVIRSPSPVSGHADSRHLLLDLGPGDPPRGRAIGPVRDAAGHGQITVNGVAVHGGAAAVTLVNGETIELHAP